MNDQQDFLLVIADRLGGAGIPFMLTGSVAMSIYAQPRMTRNIDLVVKCSDVPTQDWLRLFSGDCYLSEEAIDLARSRRGMFNIIHNETVTKANIIVCAADEYRQLEFERRQDHDIGGRTIPVVAPEDLLLSKLVWWKESESALQRADLELLVSAVPNLDFTYIKKWAQVLGVAGHLEQIV